MFDFKNISDFEKHIELSIPNYRGLVDTVRAVALEFLDEDSIMVDIGCSSGILLNSMRDKTRAALYGCDLVDMGYHKEYIFSQVKGSDFLEQAEDGSVGVISCLFTLQFMSRKERKTTIDAIRRHVQAGGVAIIAEKVHFKSTRVDGAVFRQHQRGKLGSFTAAEILEKDLALSGSMFPRSSAEMEKELYSLGDYDQIWQSYNFKAWCVYGS